MSSRTGSKTCWRCRKSSPYRATFPMVKARNWRFSVTPSCCSVPPCHRRKLCRHPTTPKTIQESGRTVVDAFTRAGTIAITAITLLLLVILRRPRDVLLVLVPLLLAGLLTGVTSVLLDLPLNYANIITLPLLLGIGVAFDIYFVMRGRAGMSAPLQSSPAGAVLFSALTTMTACGSLPLSSHPGTAEMGRLLTIALGFVLLCTLFVLPALQGEVLKR